MPVIDNLLPSNPHFNQILQFVYISFKLTINDLSQPAGEKAGFCQTICDDAACLIQSDATILKALFCWQQKTKDPLIIIGFRSLITQPYHEPR